MNNRHIAVRYCKLIIPVTTFDSSILPFMSGVPSLIRSLANVGTVTVATELIQDEHAIAIIIVIRYRMQASNYL